jgi:hypothetical protein
LRRRSSSRVQTDRKLDLMNRRSSSLELVTSPRLSALKACPVP